MTITYVETTTSAYKFEVLFDGNTYDLTSNLALDVWNITQSGTNSLTIEKREELAEHLQNFDFTDMEDADDDKILNGDGDVPEISKITFINIPVTSENKATIPGVGEVELGGMADTIFHTEKITDDNQIEPGDNAIKIKEGEFMQIKDVVLFFDSEGLMKLKFEIPGFDLNAFKAILLLKDVDMTDTEATDLYNHLTTGIEITCDEKSKMQFSNPTDLLPADIQNLATKLLRDSFCFTLYKSEKYIYIGLEYNTVPDDTDAFAYNGGLIGNVVSSSTKIYIKETQDGEFEEVDLTAPGSAFEVTTTVNTSILFISPRQNFYQGIISYEYDVDADGNSDLTIYTPFNTTVNTKIHLELLKNWLLKARYVAQLFGDRQPVGGVNLKTYVNVIFTVSTKMDTAGTGVVA